MWAARVAEPVPSVSHTRACREGAVVGKANNDEAYDWSGGCRLGADEVRQGMTESDCAGQPRAAWNAATAVARNGHGPKGLGHS